MSKDMLIVTQIKSKIGRAASHRACLRGLGIRRMHNPVTVKETPENLGMINQISYMLDVRKA